MALQPVDCSVCKSTSTIQIDLEFDRRVYVRCTSRVCNTRGPMCTSQDEAIIRWNKLHSEGVFQDGDSSASMTTDRKLIIRSRGRASVMTLAEWQQTARDSRPSLLVSSVDPNEEGWILSKKEYKLFFAQMDELTNNIKNHTQGLTLLVNQFDRLQQDDKDSATVIHKHIDAISKVEDRLDLVEKNNTVGILIRKVSSLFADKDRLFNVAEGHDKNIMRLKEAIEKVHRLTEHSPDETVNAIKTCQKAIDALRSDVGGAFKRLDLLEESPEDPQDKKSEEKRTTLCHKCGGHAHSSAVLQEGQDKFICIYCIWDQLKSQTNLCDLVAKDLEKKNKLYEAAKSTLSEIRKVTEPTTKEEDDGHFPIDYKVIAYNLSVTTLRKLAMREED